MYFALACLSPAKHSNRQKSMVKYAYAQANFRVTVSTQVHLLKGDKFYGFHDKPSGDKAPVIILSVCMLIITRAPLKAPLCS